MHAFEGINMINKNVPKILVSTVLRTRSRPKKTLKTTSSIILLRKIHGIALYLAACPPKPTAPETAQPVVRPHSAAAPGALHNNQLRCQPMED